MYPEKNGVCPRCLEKRALLRRIAGYGKPHWTRVALLTVITGTATAISLVPPLITKKIVDGVLWSEDPHFMIPDRITMLGLLVLALFGVQLVSWLLGFVHKRVSTWLGARITADMRNELYRRTLRLRVRFHDKREVGALMKGALDYIFQPHLYPDLYKDVSHVVRINYYPPRGDNKEGWDNIDIFGWLGYPMQLKINFLCRDSILAAPIVVDLALFLDLAKRAGMSGIQEWLSFYFKSPMHAPGLYPEHDLFIQLMKLKNTLRYMVGEELITHLGREYYD